MARPSPLPPLARDRASSSRVNRSQILPAELRLIAEDEHPVQMPQAQADPMGDRPAGAVGHHAGQVDGLGPMRCAAVDGRENQQVIDEAPEPAVAG